MNRNRAMRTIDAYLERVRSYLPLVDDSYMLELRTHLIQEAERLGNGTITEGSALMAVEHMGDPRTVANEYAGSGEKVGPIPVEYVRPFAVLVAVFIGAGLSVAAGWLIADRMFPGVLTFLSGSILVSLTILFSLVFALIAVERMNIIDMRDSVAEPTFFERFLGVGANALRKKRKRDAILSIVGGIVFPLLLYSPPVFTVLSDGFIALLPAIVTLSLFTAVLGILFYRAGENNLTLLLEVFENIALIIIALLLIGILPVTTVYSLENGILVSFDLNTIFADYPIAQEAAFGMWGFVIIVVVITHVWGIIVDVVKVSWNLREGRGLWWQDSL